MIRRVWSPFEILQRRALLQGHLPQPSVFGSYSDHDEGIQAAPAVSARRFFFRTPCGANKAISAALGIASRWRKGRRNGAGGAPCLATRSSNKTR